MGYEVHILSVFTHHTYQETLCGIVECHVEGKGEGKDEEEGEADGLAERVEDVHKHQNVNTCQRKREREHNIGGKEGRIKGGMQNEKGFEEKRLLGGLESKAAKLSASSC